MHKQNKQLTPLTAKRSSSGDQSKLQRLRAFLERHRLAAILICGVLLVFIGCAAAFYLTYQPPVVSTDHTPIARKKKAEPVKYYSQLNGVEVADEAAVTKPVTAVMIENSPDSRPQSGIKQARSEEHTSELQSR